MLLELNLREEYVIAQALALGIRELNKVSDPYKEQSNIADMDHLLHDQFGRLSNLALASLESHERVLVMFPAAPGLN